MSQGSVRIGRQSAHPPRLPATRDRCRQDDAADSLVQRLLLHKRLCRYRKESVVTADHIAYRIEKYEKMGFSYPEACTLSHTFDDAGLPLYWDDVVKLLEKTGGNHAIVLDILISGPEVPMVQYGGEDDGA